MEGEITGKEGRAMRFMMLMYPGEQAERGEMPDEAAIAAMMKYNEELANAGVLLSLDGLHPSANGARVTFVAGDPVIPDGPFAQAKPGPMLVFSGRVVGGNQGVMRYTVGQRKGLGLARPEPTFVVGIDAATNTLTVGEESALYRSTFEAGRANFVSIDMPTAPIKVDVRVRHRGRAVSGTVTPLGQGRLRIELDEPERAITPGQSAVFYDGDVLVGGALIESAIG